MKNATSLIIDEIDDKFPANPMKTHDFNPMLTYGGDIEILCSRMM